MNYRILIVEDNDDIRENIAELLSLHEFNVSEAENGQIGIDKAINEKPQLILCDIAMSKKNGFEVLEALRNNPDVSEIPFVFMTSSAQEKDIARGKLAGADAYIAKPFKLVELIILIKGFLP
jgi:CheY-like chemotaxis protein